MMSQNRKASLKATAEILQRRADRALQFWGVRSALLSEEIKMPPHSDFIAYVKPLRKGQRYATPAEISILRSKGNPAIKMNDLFRVTGREFSWLISVAPSRITRWCRTLDYDKDMWWSDPDRPVDARPASIKENWNSARSLTLAGAADHEPTQIEEIAEELSSGDASEGEPNNDSLDPQNEENEGSAIEGIVTRNQNEREELAEEVDLDRPNSVFGEDYWTETEYPVLESQASFMARGSNDDLDDFYGEEPRDPQAERDAITSRIQKGRGWRASRAEEQFQEASVLRYNPTAHFMPSNALPELFGEDQPAPGFDEEGKLKQGFFITRSEFFAQRDQRLEGLDSDYQETTGQMRELRVNEIAAKGITRDYRGWCQKRGPGKLDLELIRQADMKHGEQLPKAPKRPFAKKGQRWVGVIKGEIVKPSEVCEHSD